MRARTHSLSKNTHTERDRWRLHQGSAFSSSSSRVRVVSEEEEVSIHFFSKRLTFLSPKSIQKSTFFPRERDSRRSYSLSLSLSLRITERRRRREEEKQEDFSLQTRFFDARAGKARTHHKKKTKKAWKSIIIIIGTFWRRWTG